jgi:hypothetical protein
VVDGMSTTGVPLRDCSWRVKAGIERKLERLRRLLLNGDLEQREYRAEQARLEAELAALAPASRELAAALPADLGSLWDVATPHERKTLAGRLFESVYRDLDRSGVIDAILRPALLPLWEALPHGFNWVTDGA